MPTFEPTAHTNPQRKSCFGDIRPATFQYDTPRIGTLSCVIDRGDQFLEGRFGSSKDCAPANIASAAWYAYCPAALRKSW